MAPRPGSNHHHHNRDNYGSVSNAGIGVPEEGKCQSSDVAAEHIDMEQMRLIVSSLRQQHHQDQLNLAGKQGPEVKTQVPPFSPDDYYYLESRQFSRRTILGIVLGLVGGLLLTKGWSLWQASFSPSTNLKSHRKLVGDFDYVVIGGGPSGIIAATKLAQKLPKAQIVLLESGSVSQSSVLEAMKAQNGPDTTTTSSLSIDPSGRTIQQNLQPDSTLNKYDIPLMWSGIAETQRRMQSFQLPPDPITSTYWPIPLGLLTRGLGGCGLHNAMIYIRSLPSCFERWNLPQWTFDKMLPVYKSLEHYMPENLNAADKEWLQTRGHEGPIRTTPAGPETDTMGAYFVQSALASGIPMSGGADHPSFNHINPEDRVGAGYYEFNTRNGVRESVASAFLGDTTKIPSNLQILTAHTVTQVLFTKTDADPPRAVGVTFLDHETGERGKVLLTPKSSSEVILATGAIMTPQILWNSGIGDGGQMIHLPGVGKNLQDHPVLGMAFQVTTKMTEDAPQMYAVSDEMEDYKLATKVLNDMEKREERASKKSSSLEKFSLKYRKQRVREKLGILGTAGFSAGVFLRSPWKEGGAPDIQLTVFPRVVEPHQPKSKSQINVNFMRARAMLVTVALLEPEARYEVRPSNMTSLQAPERTVSTSKTEEKVGSEFSKALQYPLPSLQLPHGRKEYLTDRDVKRLAWGMEQVRRIMRFPPMSNVTTTELYPGPSVVDDGVTLDEYIRANHLANSHWVGSTKMGRDDDPLAVLDESLRVRGVTGLRVFDSGAIPFVPNGNTHSTVCAVASRGVDLILEELGSS